MTWIISKALLKDYENSRCSRERAGESSEENCSDGEPSAQLNVMPTLHQFSRNDKTMDILSRSPFGLTYAHLTESRGEDVLTWFREVSRVRTSVLRDQTTTSTDGLEDLMEKGQGYGQRWPELLTKFDPVSRSWKIPTDLLGEDLGEFSETWPRSGTMRNGCAYQRESVERPMSGRAYGFLPTPTAHNAKEGAYPAEYTRKTPTLATHAGGKINPEWQEWLMMWPIGWTGLEPVGMDKFLEWRRLHSSNSTSD